nr:hypothetical protein Iba_chr12dCG7500 [Ipomoea batatas]
MVAIAFLIPVLDLLQFSQSPVIPFSVLRESAAPTLLLGFSASASRPRQSALQLPAFQDSTPTPSSLTALTSSRSRTSPSHWTPNAQTALGSQ